MHNQPIASRIPKYSRHLYAALMYAYPPDFRARFGGEMMQVFQDSYPGEGAVLATVCLWLGTLQDLAVSLPNSWCRELREANESDEPSWMISIPVFVLATIVLVAEGWFAATLAGRLIGTGVPGEATILFRINLLVSCGLTSLSGALAVALARRQQIDLVILRLPTAA
jgi:hypothetical protein